MEKVKIKIIQYGMLAQQIDYKKIINHKSSIFEVISYDYHPNMPDCDNGVDYICYPDKQWERLMPKSNHKVDLVFGITDFALDDNFYSRRLKNGRVIFSFRNIREYLNVANIPLENMLIKQLYEYCIYLFKQKYSQTAPMYHNETRCCLYDKNGAIDDIALSCSTLQLCDECKDKLRSWGFNKKEIKALVKELKKVKKPSFYIILDWIKRHPIIAILLSFVFSVISELVSSGIIYIWPKYIWPMVKTMVKSVFLYFFS